MSVPENKHYAAPLAVPAPTEIQDHWVPLPRCAIPGFVVRVRDGDSWVGWARPSFMAPLYLPFRLANAYCPEEIEPGGPEATAYTTRLIQGKQVALIPTGQMDPRSRWLAGCQFRERGKVHDLGERLIAAGHATREAVPRPDPTPPPPPPHPEP